nr:hypothetical protein 1 [Gammaproteobacteria bacterium]
MAKIEFELIHGVEVGGQLEKHVVLRELTAGEIVEVGIEAETVVYSNYKPMYIPSPTKVAALSLCRQVFKLGSINGPIDLSLLKKMHADDFELMQYKATELDAAARTELEALSDRGRSAGDGG